MAGTKAGAKQMSKTIKQKYGKDFWRVIGRMGGQAGTTGGFWYQKYILNNEEFIRQQGVKGGQKSRRTWGPADRAKHSRDLRRHYAHKAFREGFSDETTAKT